MMNCYLREKLLPAFRNTFVPEGYTVRMLVKGIPLLKSVQLSPLFVDKNIPLAVPVKIAEVFAPIDRILVLVNPLLTGVHELPLSEERNTPPPVALPPTKIYELLDANP
jgi:hypothetical protein